MWPLDENAFVSPYEKTIMPSFGQFLLPTLPSFSFVPQTRFELVHESFVVLLRAEVVVQDTL